MVEIVKVLKEHMPAVTFIGKCYADADRGPEGGFGGQWGQWHQNGWFNTLDALGTLPGVEDGDLGLMGCSDQDGSFQYWIGRFFPENTAAPEGFDAVDIPEGDVGVCWIYGREDTGEIFGEEPHNQCMAALNENGMGHLREDFKGAEKKWWWFFERYTCPRFTTPDEQGKVILDYGFYIN